MKKLLMIILLTVISILRSDAQGYQVIDLGTLGGSEATPHSINDHGQITGFSSTTNDGAQHAFLYSGGLMKDIGTLGGDYSFGRGINNSGNVIGVSAISPGNNHAFLYTNGIMHDLGALGGANQSDAFGINDTGQITGSSSGNAFSSLAFLHSNGVMNALSNIYSEGFDINNSGQIVGGHIISNGNYFAFLYSNGIMQNLGSLGGFMSKANKINDNGEIVGFAYLSGDLVNHAFLYSNGQMHDLGTLGGARSRALGINNLGQIVGASQIPNDDFHPFLYSNGIMKDLNNLIPTNSGWFIDSVYDINNHGQIIGIGINSSDEIRAILLNPLPEGWEQAITNQPIFPTYGDLPEREEGKDSLILVTHGHNPDMSWLYVMTNSIKEYLIANNLTNWQVWGYDWEAKAQNWIPSVSLSRAEEDGDKAGKKLSSDGWSHVHFVAHSAGAGFIRHAAEAIKTNGSIATIHGTFLDPFTGLRGGGTVEYGKFSDWSDTYFSKDDLPRTESLLENSYNVEVTDLNKQVQFGLFESGTLDPCMQSVSSHAWPHEFYENTITGNINSQYKGFGFPLSKEGGGWDYALANYAKGGSTNLGIPDPVCISFAGSSTMLEFPISPSSLSSYASGTVVVGPNSIQILTQSPSWIPIVVNLTNSANYVSFEAVYTTTNADPKGLMTSIWDTNILGQLDEQAVLPGLRRYTYAFPNAPANSTHVLGFRLDPFTNVQSSILITNITLGFAGPNEPFSLSVTTNTVDNHAVMVLTGPQGFTYAVEASTNLVNWETVIWLSNTNGSVQFYDQSSTNFSQRFYRAAVPR